MRKNNVKYKKLINKVSQKCKNYHSLNESVRN